MADFVQWGADSPAGPDLSSMDKKLNRNRVNKMQDRSDAGHEGCRTGVIRTGGVRTGGMQDRKYAGKVGCRTGGVYDRRGV